MSSTLPEGYDPVEIMDEYLDKVLLLHNDYVYFDDVINMMCLCDPKLTTRQVRGYTVLLEKVMRHCLVKRKLRVSFLGDGNLFLNQKEPFVKLYDKGLDKKK